jgi:hypothetical protein
VSDSDYWRECISQSAEECGVALTDEQLSAIAEDVSVGHRQYGMAFYSPPSSDRVDDIRDEWKGKLAKLQREFDDYRANAESHMKRATRLHSDANVSIGRDGVFAHDGRTTRVL